MHCNYKEKREAVGKVAVFCNKYSEIFYFDFNITFHIPKKKISVTSAPRIKTQRMRKRENEKGV